MEPSRHCTGCGKRFIIRMMVTVDDWPYCRACSDAIALHRQGLVIQSERDVLVSKLPVSYRGDRYWNR